jgi:predicted permease
VGTEIGAALKGLRAAPGTAGLAIFLLALGLAAATVTFSVVDHVVLRQLPFPDDEKLFVIGRTTSANPTPGNVSPQDFLAWKERMASVADLAGAGQWIPLRLTTDSGPVSLRTVRVTSNLFNLLGVSPAMGSPWQPDQERPGSDPIVAISYALWERQFGSDSTVVGRTVAFGSKSLRVVAVMPPGFTYPVDVGAPVDAWIPFAFNDRERDPASPGRSGNILAVGRLRAGATIAVARAGVEETTASMSQRYPTWGWKDARPVVEPLRGFVAGPSRRWMVLVLGAVTLVLLVANVNVANLLLARAAGRGPELAMRAALGASPGRLLQMLLFESAILSAAAGALGLVISARGIRIVKAVLPDGIARASTISLDARVVIVSIVAALLTGVVFSVVPAWRASRVDLVGVLKRGASRMSGAGAGLSWRSVFLVSEIAFVTAVLVATSLFVTSFVRVVGTDLGFERRGLVAMQVPSGSFDSLPEPNRAAARGAYFDDVLRRAKDAAGDERVAMVDGALPLLTGGVQYAIHRPDVAT